MIEVIILLAIALIWIIFATVQDLKSREIANWVSFSLIIFALGFRFFYSLFLGEGEDFSFFIQGVIGLGIFLILGNIFYYSRMFAGGDTKLMISLGTILPLYNNILDNLKFFLIFFLVFLISGAVYGIASILYLSFRNFKTFKKELSRQFKAKKKLIILGMLGGIVFLIIGLFFNVFFSLGIMLFLTPYVYLYVTAVDKTCMIKDVKAKNLTEGDWLYKDVKIGKKYIKADWDGLEKNEIREIRKRYPEVKIKQGIPFSPVFLISYIIIVILFLLKINLWNSFR
ncbi:MAG: prepilin peptidase [Nanoarchaeota archaeon]|nr:prepilin peptidase [Nanoarchaeota archaeon]